MIRTGIVEDVVLARERLRRMLCGYSDIRIVGEAGDMNSGAALLRSAEPDLLFLDVTLPDGEGPDLLHAIPQPQRPLIIFLTARADHAVPAFDLEAVDYLLKPVGEAELSRALERVRRRLSATEESDTHITIREGRTKKVVRVEDVELVEAAGHYLCLNAGGEVHLVREPLSAFAERFAKAGFLRVHRSALVRLAAVERIEEKRNGDALVYLKGGGRTTVSRTYRAEFESRLRGQER